CAGGKRQLDLDYW
nr:immunoglobulin heavy chain junction region [Macaca mulatta]